MAALFSDALDCPAKRTMIYCYLSLEKRKFFPVYLIPCELTVFDDRQDMEDGSQLIHTADGLRVQR